MAQDLKYTLCPEEKTDAGSLSFVWKNEKESSK